MKIVWSVWSFRMVWLYGPYGLWDGPYGILYGPYGLVYGRYGLFDHTDHKVRTYGHVYGPDLWSFTIQKTIHMVFYHTKDHTYGLELWSVWSVWS